MHPQLQKIKLLLTKKKVFFVDPSVFKKKTLFILHFFCEELLYNSQIVCRYAPKICIALCLYVILIQYISNPHMELYPTGSRNKRPEVIDYSIVLK